MESFLGKTVILADGDFPSGDAAVAALRGAARVVCCDRAAVAYAARFGRPAAVVGDCDSLPADARVAYADILEHDPGQDDNDLAKAFRFCLRRGWRDIVVLGATGRREDHALGNVSWLADFAAVSPGVAMVTDWGVFTVLLPPGGNVATTPGMQISFFSFDPHQSLNAEGVVYPVRGLRLRRWHDAALNEATGDEVSFSFVGEPVIVYRAFAADR